MMMVMMIMMMMMVMMVIGNDDDDDDGCAEVGSYNNDDDDDDEMMMMVVVNMALISNTLYSRFFTQVSDRKILQNDWLRFDQFGAAVTFIIDCVTESSDVRDLSREVKIALFNLRNYVAKIVSTSTHKLHVSVQENFVISTCTANSFGYANTATT